MLKDSTLDQAIHELLLRGFGLQTAAPRQSFAAVLSYWVGIMKAT